ncbi:FkbM family methyltransferase [Pseudochelatococcus sp. B33]
MTVSPRRLKTLLKNSLLAQYAYRKWYYPFLGRHGDTDELLIPRLAIRTAVDVGANAGTYALALARVSERLICFEPVPFMSRLLHRLLGRAGHVVIDDRALSDSNGTANLSVPLQGGGAEMALATLRTVFPQSTNVEVRTIRLDDFWQAHAGLDPATVDFVKIDVEGVEGKVLAGMAETIAAAHPVLLIEIELRCNPAGVAIFADLAARGYRAYVSRVGGELEPVAIETERDLLDIQKPEDVAREHFSYRLGDTRRYLNNFWFIHPGSALAAQLEPFIRTPRDPARYRPLERTETDGSSR